MFCGVGITEKFIITVPYDKMKAYKRPITSQIFRIRFSDIVDIIVTNVPSFAVEKEVYSESTVEIVLKNGHSYNYRQHGNAADLMIISKL